MCFFGVYYREYPFRGWSVVSFGYFRLFYSFVLYLKGIKMKKSLTKKERPVHKITSTPLNLRMDYSKGMMDQYGGASLHMTMASVIITSGKCSEKNSIGEINCIIGGGLEIQDLVREETWVLTCEELWKAYSKARENCNETDNEGRPFPKPKKRR